MKKAILLGGYGGQGVQTLGKLLALAFTEAGNKVAFVPDYSGSMRGGISNCTLIISDEEISSPLLKDLDILIALNEGAKHAFESRLVPGGALIYNMDMVKCQPERKDILAAGLPAHQTCGAMRLRQSRECRNSGLLYPTFRPDTCLRCEKNRGKRAKLSKAAFC